MGETSLHHFSDSWKNRKTLELKTGSIQPFAIRYRFILIVCIRRIAPNGRMNSDDWKQYSSKPASYWKSTSDKLKQIKNVYQYTRIIERRTLGKRHSRHP